MKLFNLLNQFEKRELRKFQQFISNPLFNKRDDVKELLNNWIKENGKKYPPATYWSIVFPNKKHDPNEWHLLTSRLFKLVEEYLAISEMREDKAQKKFYLAKAYRKIQQEKLFAEAIRDANKILKKQNLRDTAYLQAQHDLAFEKYDYIISINRKEKTNLQEVSNHLDAYIIAAKLRQACYALSREIINQEKYNIGFLEEILQYIDKHPDLLQTPAIAIYYYCFQVISTDNSESSYVKLRDAITQHQNLFPAAEVRDIYTLAINYAIRKLNTGATLFISVALDLYQLSLKQGYLLEDGIILESTFSNIVFLASKLKEFEWAEQFIHKYKKHLKADYQNPIFHLSLGKLYYEQGKLDSSLKQLAMVESKASFLLLGARILQLKIYYELKEYDPLESLLESLRVYLQRSKNLGYRKENYINILSFSKQLLQLPVMTIQEKKALENKINNTKILTEREWFLKQIESGE